jgi:hypothetical protein
MRNAPGQLRLLIQIQRWLENCLIKSTWSRIEIKYVLRIESERRSVRIWEKKESERRSVKIWEKIESWIDSRRRKIEMRNSMG